MRSPNLDHQLLPELCFQPSLYYLRPSLQYSRSPLAVPPLPELPGLAVRTHVLLRP